MISVFWFLVFIAAWFVAEILLKIVEGKIQKANMQKMIDSAYLKLSKLVVSTMSDKGGKK